MNFIAADTVLSVGFKPDSHGPLVQAKWRIFHDRAGLNGELAAIVPVAALVAAVFLGVRNIPGTATRAYRPVGPSHLGKEFLRYGEVRKILDGLHQRFDFCDILFPVHAQSVSGWTCVVKYIIT